LDDGWVGSFQTAFRLFLNSRGSECTSHLGEKHSQSATPVEKSMTASWQVWALLSAIFAAFTAIFAKIGVENINSDLATFIRTIVILVVLAGILFSLGEFQPLGSISGRTYVFLVLSG